MAEYPYVKWRIAFDANSTRLQCDDFKNLGVKECKHLLTENGQTLMRLRLEKRVRSNPVVDELRRLQNEGRINKAWIEKRSGTKDDAAELLSLMLNGAPVELERIYALEEDAGEKKKKKKAAPQTTPSISSASTTPLMSNECDVDEEDEEEEEDGEEESDDANEADIKSLIKSCMQDIQKRLSQLEQQVLQHHKRSKKHHHRSPSPPPKAKPVQKPKELLYNRPPVKLSFLRTASISELYYSGVWVPEFDVDTEFVGRPKREIRFRSELPADQYVEGYDVDDITHDVAHEDIMLYKNKADALKRPFHLHFVDRHPFEFRKAVTLNSLRKAPLDVLCYLKIFFLGYDIDDETHFAGPIPDRPRATASQLCTLCKLPPGSSTEGFYLIGHRFYEGYDIEDRNAEAPGKRIQKHATAVKEEIKKERQTSM